MLHTITMDGEKVGHAFRGNQYTGGIGGRGMTDKERALLAEYVHSSANMAAAVRGEKSGRTVATAQAKKLIDKANELDALVRESTLTAPTVLYRGISKWDAAKVFPGGLRVGEIGRDNMLLSTSTDKEVALEFASHKHESYRDAVVLHIRAKKGDHALPTDNVYEQEVLLPSNTALRITRVARGFQGSTSVYVDIVREDRPKATAKPKPSVVRTITTATGHTYTVGGGFAKGGKAHDHSITHDGEKAGHPFRGNQYTGGKGGAHEKHEVEDGVATRLGPPPLHQFERTALVDYTDWGYESINKLAREEPGWYGEAAHVNMAHLDKIIGRSRLEQDTTLYRGISKEAVAQLFPSGVRVGDVIHDKGFSSTSTKFDSALTFSLKRGEGGAIIKIAAKRGKKGIANSVDPALVRLESEVILPRGSKFKITGETTGWGGVRMIEVVYV